MIKTPTDLSEVCRLCLQPGERLEPIFDDDIPYQPEVITLSSKIMACVSVKISPTDQGPLKICNICMNNVNRWYQFNEACKAVDVYLQKYLSVITEKNDSPPKVDDATSAICENSLLNDFSLSSFDATFGKNLNLKTNLSSILDVYFNGETPQIDDETDKAIDCSANKVVDASSENTVKPVIAQPVISNVVEKKSPKKRRKGYNCDLCDGTFLKFDDLLKHDDTVHQNVFQGVSKKTITVEPKIAQHDISDRVKENTSKKGRKSYNCELCDATFFRFDALLNHLNHDVHQNVFRDMSTVTVKPVIAQSDIFALAREKALEKRRKGYNCKLCDAAFFKFDALLKHDDTVHQNVFRDVSNKTITVEPVIAQSDIPDLAKEKAPKKRRQGFNCELCDATFLTFDALLNHNDTVHQNVFRDVNSKKITVEPVIAQHDISDLDKEKAPKNGCKGYNCELCDSTFLRFDTLLHHDDTVHENVFREFSCSSCGRLFISQNRLETHAYTHREKKHECGVCYKLFSSAKSLAVHCRLHTGQYECTTCGFRSTSKSYLEEHLLKHIGNETVYRCKICSLSFKLRSSLLRHENTHLKHGGKIYKCSVCSIVTRRRCELQKHMASHSKDKPREYKCDVCSKMYKSERTLKAHTIRHKEAQLECGVCSKKFHLNYELHEHEDTHSNDKRFSCFHCNKKFSFRSTLIKHLKHKVPRVRSDIAVM